MNKDRRKDIAKVIADIGALDLPNIEDFINDVESIRDEEQEYLDNMPEGLRYSGNGERAEEAISALEEAIDALNEIADSLERLTEVVDALNTASE